MKEDALRKILINSVDDAVVKAVAKAARGALGDGNVIGTIAYHLHYSLLNTMSRPPVMPTEARIREVAQLLRRREP